MNFKEIEIEVNAEYDVLCKSSTLERLTYEYLLERKKLKIKPQEKYTRFYNIKSKKKNNWLLMFMPEERCQFVKGPEDITAMCILYYQSDKGLRFIVANPTKIIVIYNQHLFSRYKERLQLEELNIIDTAKKFFSVNSHSTFQTFPPDENGCRKVLGVLNDGFALGEALLLEEDIIYHYKTFIARDTANFKHAKSLFELEKICKNSQDEESKLLYKALGFDENKADNSQFFEQWNSLREKIINSDEQSVYYKVVPKK